MAIVGGAIIPIAQGALADRMGIHLAFVLPAVCCAGRGTRKGKSETCPTSISFW
jgi:hypothetical protein